MLKRFAGGDVVLVEHLIAGYAIDDSATNDVKIVALLNGGARHEIERFPLRYVDPDPADQIRRRATGKPVTAYERSMATARTRLTELTAELEAQ